MLIYLRDVFTELCSKILTSGISRSNAKVVGAHFLFFRAIINEKEGTNAETTLTDCYEMSIFENPIGKYFKYELQKDAWKDEDCKFQNLIDRIH